MKPAPILALAPWYGSKRTLAPVIADALGEHSFYFEPFCGSAAVLLAKKPGNVEMINDLHGDLTNLARCLKHRSAGAELVRSTRRVLFCEGVFEDAVADIAEPFPEGRGLHVDRAVSFLIASWMGRNGIAGSRETGSLAVRWAAGGGDPAVRWQSVVRSIPAWRSRLARVQILQRDAIEILWKLADKPGLAIYADPPYLAKSGRYVHDFDSRHHEQLAQVLGRFRNARVVVSYYSHPLLSSLYPFPHWMRTEVPVRKFMGNTSGKAAGAAPEVLITNGGTR